MVQVAAKARYTAGARDSPPPRCRHTGVTGSVATSANQPIVRERPRLCRRRRHFLRLRRRVTGRRR